MTFFGEEDIDVMLAESPTQATIGGVTASVIVTRVGEDLLGGAGMHVQATRILLTAKTGQFPALRPGADVVIGTATYVATDVKRSGDGALSEALCEIAP